MELLNGWKQLTKIKFGGDGNIKVDTLTEFLNNYLQLINLINNELGYNPNDMIIVVSPPENGSFKIKLNNRCTSPWWSQKGPP